MTTVPMLRVTDANGDPVSGGVVQIKEGGTETLATIYSDQSLSTSLGTYVEADAEGYFGDIYVAVGNYDVTLRAAGVTGGTPDGAVLVTYSDVYVQAGSSVSPAEFSLVTATQVQITNSPTAYIQLLESDTNAQNRIEITSGNMNLSVDRTSAVANPELRFQVQGTTFVTLDDDGIFEVTGYVRTVPVTVAGLAAAATVGAGSRAFVTDATATTFMSTVSGGGANSVPVVSDGTNWLIG